MNRESIRHGVVSFLATVAMAGCASGSSQGASGAETVMVSAATKSEAASTFHLSASEKLSSLSGTPFLSANSATLSGDVDLSADSARLAGTLFGALPTQGGTAPQEISFEVIRIGGDSWESTTGLGGLLQLGGSVPPGHWIKEDSSSSVSQIPDPGKLFDALKSRATNVHFVGTSTVGGVATDEYQLLGSSSLIDALGGGGSSGQSETTGPVSIQVWVDRSDLVRRLSTALKENMGPPGQVESVALTVDFTKYGQPVHIQPPPADLVLPSS